MGETKGELRSVGQADENLKYRHTLHDNILGEIVYTRPWRYTYYWPTGEVSRFSNIVRMQAMKTGCVVLHNSADDSVIVVPPNYLYCLEEPMGGK